MSYLSSCSPLYVMKKLLLLLPLNEFNSKMSYLPVLSVILFFNSSCYMVGLKPRTKENRDKQNFYKFVYTSLFVYKLSRICCLYCYIDSVNVIANKQTLQKIAEILNHLFVYLHKKNCIAFIQQGWRVLGFLFSVFIL